MTKRAKTPWGMLLLFLLLLSLGFAVAKVYQEGRKQELNRALVAATERHDIPIVIHLLSEGADPNTRELPTATNSLWERLWDRLRGNPLSIPTGFMPTVLERAMPYTLEGEYAHEDLTLLRALLDAGASANFADENGNNTPLILAVVAAREDTVQLLLDRGAQANAHDRWGMTALHFAAVANDPVIVQLLISHGASVNARDLSGRTPLHIAALRGHENAALVLVAHGADVDAQENDGSTPLADDYLSTDIVKLLLAHGAHTNIRDKNGLTPLMRAHLYSLWPVFDYLKQLCVKE